MIDDDGLLTSKSSADLFSVDENLESPRDETKESSLLLLLPPPPPPPPTGGPMAAVVAEEEEASAAVPLFFLAFFLLGSAAPKESGLADDDCAEILGGNGRFWGLVLTPALFGGAIFPDAGSLGRDGRCLRGSSRSSTRGSSPLA